MQDNTIYFIKNEFYEIIRKNGGIWNDTKKRPVVCLLQDKKVSGLYWAIPMGAWEHRNRDAKSRIKKYISLPKDNIASNFYHLGRTTQKSIFFISDAFPVTQKYVEREYTGFDNNPYVVKNEVLISELTRKLDKILKFEQHTPNYFRQNITNVKKYLINELNSSQ